jgi:glutathione S-transferase
MLKLFGQARSRVSRSLWMLEEIGIPYQREPVRPYTESRSAEYLRINPNGHIPSLDDDGFILWESLAINLYLAETYASAPLWPAGAKDHGRIYQWSLWAANEIEPRIVSIAKGLSKTSPDPQAVAIGLEQLSAALRILKDRLLAPYLLGANFTRRSQPRLDSARTWRGGNLRNRRDRSCALPECRRLARSLQRAACQSPRRGACGLTKRAGPRLRRRHAVYKQPEGSRRRRPTTRRCRKGCELELSRLGIHALSCPALCRASTICFQRHRE